MVSQAGIKAEKEVAAASAPDVQEGGQLVPMSKPGTRLQRIIALAAVSAALSIGATVAAYIVVNREGRGRTLHLTSARTSAWRNAFLRMRAAWRAPAQRVRSVIVHR